MTDGHPETSTAVLTGPGGAFEVENAAINGVTFRIFKRAPSHLRDMYRTAVERHGRTTCYVYEGERYSFADAWNRASRVANALASRGVRPGDRVGVSMRNYPEWIWAFLGITSLGAVAVAMNAWWSGEEMLYAIDDSGLKTLFVDRERLEHLSPFLDERELNVITVRTGHTSGRGTMPWDTFMAAAGDAMPDHEVARDAPATLIYTSGSTAHPKGVLSSHRAIIHALMGWEGATALATAGRPPRESTYPPAMILTVPLFHVTGLNAQFLLSFRAGRKLVGMYKWDVEKALAIIEQERITLFNGVPTMAYELVNSPKFDEYDLSSLRGIGGGGAAMSPQHSRQIDKKMKRKASPSAGYGMTETNGLGTTNAGRSLLAKPTSCGRCQALIVDIKITDDEGRSRPATQTGEIWIKGPMNFTEYWNKPEATAATLTDGWVHTGDIGHLDEEGFLYITDRAKDMVIRGGENIGCQEVEAVIYEHPKVGEVAVFGVPDARLGEAVAAVVTITTPHALTPADVKSHVAEHMARFKVPEHVWIRNEPLPRTASGKIFKRGLRDEAIALLREQMVARS